MINLSIKIYSHSFEPLVALFTQDFNKLSYSSKIDDVGDAEFTVRIDNAKITPTVIKHYNVVEIVRDNSNVVWVGVITNMEVSLDTIVVKCYSLLYTLKKRIAVGVVDVNGNTDLAITNLLNTENAKSNTGISIGNIATTTFVRATYNFNTVFNIIDNLADTTDSHFLVRPDRKLYFGQEVGRDLSNSVILRYDIKMLEISNLVGFNISSDGSEAIGKTYGASGSLSSVQENTQVTSAYGLLEDYQNFREQGDASTLDKITRANNCMEQYTPELSMLPIPNDKNIEDNFDIGDKVRLVLSNGFVEIDTTMLIIEKKVEYRQGMLYITISINDKLINLTTIINKLRGDVKKINREI